MRIALLLAALTLTACAAVPDPASQPSMKPTSPIAYPPKQLYVIPEARITPLPTRNPPAIVQSKLVKMPHAELARWALPEHAATTTRVELLSFWMPEITLGWFYERPFVTQYPGVCEVKARGVNFRTYNEASLTYAQHLDSPREPYQVSEQPRFKVLGSTLDGKAATDESCVASLPYKDWFEAPSSYAAFMALQHVDRARYRPENFDLTCTEQFYDEKSNNHLKRACNPRDYLEKLTPNLIKRIDGVVCEGKLAGRGAYPCWKITYHDPRSPGTGSEFHLLTTEGIVMMSQELLPPH
jgi:hypothetical protein